MEQTFNLSALNKFLYQILVITEEVKSALKLHCDEAIFSLKPWRVEMMVKQEVARNPCTCSKSETRVKEIAAGIGKALLQTQQLREKLSINVVKEKRLLKQPSVSEIYNPHPAGDQEKKAKNVNASNKKSPSVKKSDDNDLDGKENSLGKVLQTEIVENDIDTNTEKRKINNNQQKTVRSGKITRNKNFLAINKQNAKNTKEIRKCKNIDHKLEDNSKSGTSLTKAKCITFDKRSSAASTSELKNLIQKVASESNNCTSSSTDRIKCPIHEDVIAQFTYEQNFITIDVVDGLNGFNIPGEIIKSLKAYHTYLNNEFSGVPLDNGKQQRMFNKFLTEFNKMDRTVQESLRQDTRVVTSLPKLISLFQNLFSEGIAVADLIGIKKLYTELNSTWKLCDAKESDSLHIWKAKVQKALVHSDFDTEEWISNGIWNLFYARNFEGMSRVQCICYANKSQLLLFFEMTQQLQQIQYYKDLIETISEDVLPNIKMCFDSTKSEHVKLYKMICILCQGLNPKIPVLVRTDD